MKGGEHAPERGDSFEGEVSAVRGVYGPESVAISASIDGARRHFRNDRGLGAWEDRTNSGDRDVAGQRLTLLSDIVGARAVAQGDTDAGEIQRAVIERRSGNVALLGFDPNENFLGLGDTIKCVPWSISRVAPDGTVHIDATNEELASCQDMPEDLTVFQTRAQLVPVYRVFSVEPAGFAPRRHVATNGQKRGDRKESKGDRAATRRPGSDFFANFAETGTRLNFAGEVKQVISRPMDGVDDRVRVIVLGTDKGEREIVIAPESHLRDTEFAVAQGDRVSVLTRTARVDGRDLFVAQSIHTPDRQFTFWTGDTPAWDN